MKPYIIPGLITIIVVLCFVSLRQCEKAKEVVQVTDNTAFRTRIDKLVSDSTRSSARIDSLTVELVNVKAESKAVLAGLKIAVQARDKSLEQARAEVAVFRDSIPEVRRFVEVADSSIQVRDSLISRLENDMEVQSKLYEETIGAMGARHIATVALSSSYEARVGELELKVRKESRKRRLWRSAALVLGATTAVLILAK